MIKLLQSLSWYTVGLLHKASRVPSLAWQEFKSQKIWNWLKKIWHYVPEQRTPISKRPCSPKGQSGIMELITPIPWECRSSFHEDYNIINKFQSCIDFGMLLDITTQSTKKGYKEYISKDTGNKYLFDGMVVVEL